MLIKCLFLFYLHENIFEKKITNKLDILLKNPEIVFELHVYTHGNLTIREIIQRQHSI